MEPGTNDRCEHVWEYDGTINHVDQWFCKICKCEQEQFEDAPGGR